MLFTVGIRFSLQFCLTLYVISSGFAAMPQVPSSSQSKNQLLQHIYLQLDKLSCNQKLNTSVKFSLLLSEFLIKQKLRYEQPTRYDEQLYYHLLHKTKDLRQHGNFVDLSAMEKQITDNVFQRNVRLLPPELKYGKLDANVDYENLAQNYANVVNDGMPNATQSDQCMSEIVALEGCKLSNDCLKLLTSDSPTYGYQRTHQALLLYILQHHRCALNFGPEFVYEMLAKTICTEVQREQNAIRSLALPIEYHELYLEQVTICGLFGYNEFMNWRNVVEISSWFETDVINPSRINQHMNDLALVFFINALLLLQ